jgi:hypothetical protein
MNSSAIAPKLGFALGFAAEALSARFSAMGSILSVFTLLRNSACPFTRLGQAQFWERAQRRFPFYVVH